MAAVTMPSGEDHARNIATLSRQLQLPERDVRAVYWQILENLVAHARIGTYVSVLAMRITRATLCARYDDDRGTLH